MPNIPFCSGTCFFAKLSHFDRFLAVFLFCFFISVAAMFPTQCIAFKSHPREILRMFTKFGQNLRIIFIMRIFVCQ